ncbi:hypothetical protein TrRE_jg3616 [Triparma retinervis]|uniref:Inositol-1-monophosphatase n=1 Tax=Triparma retinervis TaxID=2557542 RepID=A0A9W7DXE8_9STRA|nr:hypothetical protein TrRE_jg3616 [Triparma retinervis]
MPLSVPTNLGSIGPLGTVAANAAVAAGNIIKDASKEMSSTAVTKTKANPRDLLTKTDPICEAEITRIIKETYPSHLILGEEAVASGPDASASALEHYLKLAKEADEHLWIVDPLDGTTNFVHSIPMSLPSVACLSPDGEVVAGCVYDGEREECFVAEVGKGAWLNGVRIEVDKGTENLGECVLAMGSPPGAESLSMSLLGINALMPKVRTIRMFGSAALMLAWVACGRLGGYWEYDLSSWDVAAGGLLIKEAGGIMGDLDDEGGRTEKFDIRKRKIVGTNGIIHEKLRGVLKDAGVIKR